MPEQRNVRIRVLPGSSFFTPSNLRVRTENGRVFMDLVSVGVSFDMHPDDADWLASNLTNCARAARLSQPESGAVA